MNREQGGGAVCQQGDGAVCQQGDGAVSTGRWSCVNREVSCVNREIELCQKGGGAVSTGRWSCVNRKVSCVNREQEGGAVSTGRWSCVNREKEGGAVSTGTWDCVNREVGLCQQGAVHGSPSHRECHWKEEAWPVEAANLQTGMHLRSYCSFTSDGATIPSKSVTWWQHCRALLTAFAALTAPPVAAVPHGPREAGGELGRQ